jgi:DNA-binding NarL/FixJ family response regulator
MVFGFFRKKKDTEIEHLQKVMQNSFRTVKDDMKNVSSWINHFKDKHSKHDQSFEQLIKEVQNLRKMHEQYLEEHHSDSRRSSVHEHVQSFERSNLAFMNVQSLKNKLTPSQKVVLELFNRANMPLDYETIASELKLNVVTVRRHVNDIRKIVEIKEMRDVDRGRKVFYLDKKAKIAIKSRK